MFSIPNSRSFPRAAPAILGNNPATATLKWLHGGVAGHDLCRFVEYGVFAAARARICPGSERVFSRLNRTFAALFVALAGRCIGTPGDNGIFSTKSAKTGDMDIPRSASSLALLVCCLSLGRVTSIAPALVSWVPILGPRLGGPFVQLQYGIVILALCPVCSGALPPEQVIGNVLHTRVLPALWAFFATGAGATSTALSLIVGFLGLLALDYQFSRWGLTPIWWMSLRILLTALVVISLALGIQI